MSIFRKKKLDPPVEFQTRQPGEAGEAKMLLTWDAPARPFRKKNRSYYTTIAIIIILLCLIAILASESLIILVLLSFCFVVYVLGFVPPHDVTYKISTQGVTTDGNFYFWHSLDSFWFNVKEGHKVLFIQTKIRFPRQLIIVVPDNLEEKIKDNVVKFIPFHEIPKTTLMERWADSLQKNFPLEVNQK